MEHDKKVTLKLWERREKFGCTYILWLVTYTQDNIPVLGCLHAKVQMDNTSTEATFFIVERGTALLGMDLLLGSQVAEW